MPSSPSLGSGKAACTVRSRCRRCSRPGAQERWSPAVWVSGVSGAREAAAECRQVLSHRRERPEQVGREAGRDDFSSAARANLGHARGDQVTRVRECSARRSQALLARRGRWPRPAHRPAWSRLSGSIVGRGSGSSGSGRSPPQYYAQGVVCCNRVMLSQGEAGGRGRCCSRRPARGVPAAPGIRSVRARGASASYNRQHVARNLLVR